MIPHDWPNIRTKYDERDPPVLHILLIDDVLICRYDQLESGLFGGLDQFSIYNASPTPILGHLDIVFAQESRHTVGHVLIKQYVQPGRAFPRS